MKVFDMQIPHITAKFILIISLFVPCEIVAMQQAPQAQLTDAEIDQIVLDADQAVRDNIVSDTEMNQFETEIQTLLDELGRQDPRPMGEFQNKVLFEMPVGREYRVTEGGYDEQGPDRWEDGHWEEERVIPGHMEPAHWEPGQWVDERRYEIGHHDAHGNWIEGQWIEPHFEPGNWVDDHWVDERREPRRFVEGRWVPGELREVPRTQRMVRPVIQVTGNHLLQVIFMTARCGLDHLFFKQLKKFYFQSVLSDWENKIQQILEVLLCIEQDEEGELLWGDSAQRLVEETFIATFTPDDTTNTKIWMLLGLYALAAECYRETQQKTLSMPWSGVTDFITRKARKINDAHQSGRIDIPIPGLLSVPEIVLYLIDSWGLGGESIVVDNLPVVRNWSLRFAGWHHQVLESYWFELAKRSLVLARFLKQTKSYFQAKTKTCVQTNKDKLCALISCLSKARVTKNEELQKEVEKRLRQFIMQAYDYPFFQWLRFKGSCIFWTTIWIELLLMSPALIEGGKLVYGYFRP